MKTCRLCGLMYDTDLKCHEHMYKQHWDWFSGYRRIQKLEQLSLGQLLRLEELKSNKKK
jgi:hypothetical protein